MRTHTETVQGVIKGYRYNRLPPWLPEIIPNSLPIAHLYPWLLTRWGGWAVLSLQTSEMVGIKDAHRGILGETWIQAAAVQGCIHCIPPGRGAWNSWGPAGVPGKILYGFVVRQPGENIKWERWVNEHDCIDPPPTIYTLAAPPIITSEHIQCLKASIHSPIWCISHFEDVIDLFWWSGLWM